jgi:hypothetical protein
MAVTTDIRDRIIAICETMQYDGSAVNAAQYVPKGIQPFQTPIFIVFPGSATRVRFADTLYEITRNWILRLYGREYIAGLHSENELRMYDLIDLTYALFLPKQRLELSGESGVTNLTQAQLTGDSGPLVRPYPLEDTDAKLYHLVEFNLATVYRSYCT